MITSNNARVLGTARQSFKCCGEHTKRGNTVQKRAAKRSERQQFRINVKREV